MRISRCVYCKQVGLFVTCFRRKPEWGVFNHNFQAKYEREFVMHLFTFCDETAWEYKTADQATKHSQVLTAKQEVIYLKIAKSKIFERKIPWGVQRAKMLTETKRAPKKSARKCRRKTFSFLRIGSRRARPTRSFRSPNSSVSRSSSASLRRETVRSYFWMLLDATIHCWFIPVYNIGIWGTLQ